MFGRWVLPLVLALAACEGSRSKDAKVETYVKQKKLSVREDIRFRLSPDDSRHLFMIKARTVFEFRGRHDVLDDLDQPIGLLEKVFGKSLLRSHWYVRAVDGTVLMEAHEASWLIALLRRFAGIGQQRVDDFQAIHLATFR